MMRDKDWIKEERDDGEEEKKKPYLGGGASRAPRPQFGSDGLFSLARAEQLEQY